MQRTRVVVGILLAIVVLGSSYNGYHSKLELTRAQAAVDATDAWNSVCAKYGFPACPVGGSATFSSVWPATATMYTFQQALDGCSSEVSHLMGTPEPGWTGDDTFNISIQNWPE
jgi:hypothetical protein